MFPYASDFLVLVEGRCQFLLHSSVLDTVPAVLSGWLHLEQATPLVAKFRDTAWNNAISKVHFSCLLASAYGIAQVSNRVCKNRKLRSVTVLTVLYAIQFHASPQDVATTMFRVTSRYCDRGVKEVRARQLLRLLSPGPSTYVQISVSSRSVAHCKSVQTHCERSQLGFFVIRLSSVVAADAAI